MKRPYDAQDLSLPSSLNLETCLRKSIRVDSAISVREFGSAFPQQAEDAEEIKQIRVKEWLNRHRLSQEAMDRQLAGTRPAEADSEVRLKASETQSDNVLQKDPPQATLLHYLAVTGQDQKLNSLLETDAAAKALIDVADSEDQMAMIAACKYEQFASFKVLLQHGAKVGLPHWAHESCLHWIALSAPLKRWSRPPPSW